MTYHQFTEALERNVKEMAGCFLSVELCNNKKNNGIIRTGLVISEQRVNVSPTIYLEGYYEQYQSGSRVDELAKEVLNVYEKVKFDQSWEEPEIFNYEKIKNKIVFRLVQRSRNEELLKEIPHVPILDLEIIFYILLEITKDGMASMQISNETMEKWNVDAKELLAIAMMNMKERLPARFHSIQTVLSEEGIAVDKAARMYVLTNEKKSFGAAAMIYPGCLNQIGTYLDENFYVLPSSVHEVIIVPEKETDGHTHLNEMVAGINAACVLPEEILENHAYYYDRREDRLAIC